MIGYKLRTTSFIMALLVLLSLLTSCKPSAEDEYTPEKFDFTLRTPLEKEGFADGYYYTENNDGTVVISSADVSGDVTVPSELSGKKVVSIGDGAFFENKTITSVTLPDTIESIGLYAFSDCSALEAFNAGASLWRISPFAFENTPWLSAQTDEFVTVGDGVLIAYNGTSRTPTLPDSVRHLGGAFAGSESLFSITFGKGVLSVSDSALAYCPNLTNIDFGSSLAYVGSQAFAGSEKLHHLIFPETLKYIGPEACLNCYLIKYIYLGKNITDIGDAAFEYCQALRVIYIPKTIKNIKTSHFKDCLSFCLIYFEGTEAEFNAVAVNDTIASFNNINIIYEYTGGINE